MDLTRTEILPQDDASPDYHAPELLLPPLKTVRNEQNLRFAGNCNAGAARAKGEYLLFVNQECVAIAPGWADAMLATFQRHPDIGIVGPKLVFPDGSIQSCGGLFDAGKGPFHRYLGWKNNQDPRCNTTEPVRWTTGAAIMIARQDFETLEGFDTGYEWGYFEDVDLCMRVRHELEKEIWYCAEATLIHEPGSTGGIPARTFKANSLRFHQKWDDVIEPDTITVHVDY